GVQAGQPRQRLPQRALGSRTGGLADDVVLVGLDLVGDVVVRDQARPPGAHPRDEPGGPPRVLARDAGHARKSTCDGTVTWGRHPRTARWGTPPNAGDTGWCAGGRFARVARS